MDARSYILTNGVPAVLSFNKAATLIDMVTHACMHGCMFKICCKANVLPHYIG